jgi:hypothetical protein
MKGIERNDCVNTAQTFYHRGTGYRTTMQTAAPELPAKDTKRLKGSRQDASIFVLSSAELAECTCPDWCERDHDRD